MASTPWNDSNSKMLRELWATGMSCRDIAARIGGMTRNAVIGKAGRLGLHPRVGGGRKGQGGRPRFENDRRAIRNNLEAARLRREALKAREALRTTPSIPAGEIEIARKTLQELEPGDCRFIPNDPRQSGPIFCALRVVPGTSWCSTHLMRCTEPVRTRQPSSTTVAESKSTVDA